MSMCATSLSDQARYAELIRRLRPEAGFVQLGYHLGSTSAPTSRTSRVTRGGKHLIKKEYLGQLSAKTENEISLLMAATCKRLRHTAAFKTVNAMSFIATEEENEGENEVQRGHATPAIELLMENYGLDLDDWLFLFHQAQTNLHISPFFYLALWHFILSAMKEFHQAGFVQVDVKADNICVALPVLDVAKSPSLVNAQKTRFTFDLTSMTLIDLGEALHPDTNKRVLLFHSNGMALGPGNTYISPYYKKQKSLVTVNDMKPLRCLDWRIDFYPLACMAENWNSTVTFPTSPSVALSETERHDYSAAIDLLRELPRWLKKNDTDPSTQPGELPHDALIKKIGRLVDLDKWSRISLELPVSIGAPLPTIVRPEVVAQQTKIDAIALGNSPATTTSFNLPDETHKHLFRRRMHRPKNAQIHIAPDALDWYRKTFKHRDGSRYGVDLLC